MWSRLTLTTLRRFRPSSGNDQPVRCRVDTVKDAAGARPTRERSRVSVASLACSGPLSGLEPRVYCSPDWTRTSNPSINNSSA